MLMAVKQRKTDVKEKKALHLKTLLLKKEEMMLN